MRSTLQAGARNAHYHMLPRTQRQKEVLDYITRFLAKHGYEPSYAQIARNFGVSSKATIAKHISALEKRGLIKREHEPGRFTLAVKVEDAPANAICEIALIENRTEAREGEIVVALIDRARATLKRMFRFGDEVELRPSNAQLEPIRVHASRVEIQGIFRGLLRPSG